MKRTLLFNGGFAVGLAFIVLYVIMPSMAFHVVHATVNAWLNLATTIFLILGRIAIGQKKEHQHRIAMTCALGFSTLFLTSYITRYIVFGSYSYPGEGWDKTLYFILLMSHMIFAMVLPFFVICTYYWGHTGQRDKHKRLARWTWPLWMYVSVTGFFVYLALYPIAGAVYGIASPV